MQRVLQAGERVLWASKPDPKVWWAERWIEVGLFVLFVIGVSIAAFLNGGPAGGWGVVGAASLLVPGILFVETLWYRSLLYAATERRIILQRGIIGRDFEVVGLDQVTDYGVKVGLVNRFVGGQTGTIEVRTASDLRVATHATWWPLGSGRRMIHVRDAYDVQRRLLELRDRLGPHGNSPGAPTPRARPRGPRKGA